MTTSTSKDLETSAIRLYPNPVKEVLYFENLTSGKVRIYNARGVLRRTSMIKRGRLNLANLAQGLYFLKVESRPHLLFSVH